MDEISEQINEQNLMFEEGVTVLNVLSISAIITTVSLFFCGIPICIKIWKQQSVGDISGMPFVTGVLGGVFWLRYGLLKFDLTMIVVNVVGVSLMTAYLIFYYVYSPAKKMITIQIMVICVLMSSMLIIVEFHGLQVIHPLGFVCMTFNILNFGAPLAGLGTVIRQKCTSSLPLPLCLATFLVSSQWCLYGTLVSDVYIITPNGIGMILAITQLSLFLVFPSTPGGQSVMKLLCSCCCGAKDDDVEARRQSLGKRTRFFCRRRPSADKSRKGSIFGRRSIVSVDLGNTLLPPMSPDGYVRNSRQFRILTLFHYPLSLIPYTRFILCGFCPSFHICLNNPDLCMIQYSLMFISALPKKISPQPCSSVHHNTSAQMPCENGAFSRSASLGSLGSLDESEFASSQRGILPNPSPHRHYHPYIVEPVQLSSVTAEVEPFGRLRDVDEHERQWSQQQQLSRTNSAPELNQ